MVLPKISGRNRGGQPSLIQAWQQQPAGEKTGCLPNLFSHAGVETVWELLFCESSPQVVARMEGLERNPNGTYSPSKERLAKKEREKEQLDSCEVYRLTAMSMTSCPLN